MANDKHLEILRQGVSIWNRWVEESREGREVWPDFVEADLQNQNLRGANFLQADLSKANLRGADLNRANLSWSSLVGANLRMSLLNAADLTRATLADADLGMADLRASILNRTDLTRAVLRGAKMGWTTFGNVDLSSSKELDTVHHHGPSTIGIDSIYCSQGVISETFLRGAGVPSDFITYMKSLIGQPVEFYSCFISHASKDEDFAKRLYSRMRDENLRVWCAPEDIRGGRKIYEQIDEAIMIHDKLLVVLSKHSMESEWVRTEIYRARQREIEEDRRVLFPIRLVDMDTIRSWKCFDADSGKDLAIEIREYHILNFQNWKDHDVFETCFQRLHQDLQMAE